MKTSQKLSRFFHSHITQSFMNKKSARQLAKSAAVALGLFISAVTVHGQVDSKMAGP